MNVKIKAEKRELGKKSDLKNLRKNGFVPAVIYGQGQEGINILLEAKSFQKVYRKTIGEVAIFDIDLDGEKHSTFIKDKQIHPVSREFVHIDFVELHKGKPITMEIPLNFVGVAKGAKEGGVVEFLQRSIEISCLPKDLPSEIEVDISNIGVGEALHFAEISLPENVTASIDDAITIVSVKEPQMKLVSEEAEEGETLADGEVPEEAEGESEEAKTDQDNS